MFIPQSEINNYPFTSNSTLLLNDSGYTLPLDLIADACAYPRCDNNAPFHVSKINKWVWTVSDNSGIEVFTIEFPEQSDGFLQNYYVGYCFDAVGPCGSVLGTTNLYNWLRAVPLSQELPNNSLVFSASAVRPVGLKNKKRALYVKRTAGNLPVLAVSWDEEMDGEGGHITVSPDGEATIKETTEYPDEGTDTPITSIIVNDASSGTSRTVNIAPAVGSKVRVATGSEITIGKVTEI